MKRILCLVLALTLMSALIFVPPVISSAATDTHGDLTYENYGGYIEVTGSDQSADPNAPSVEITSVLERFVNVKVNNCKNADAAVILAVYSKNGALIEMQKFAAWDNVTFYSENLKNVNIKVMLWSGFDTIKPLAGTAEMSL